MQGLSFPAVTAATAGALGILQGGLVFYVGGGRHKYSIGFGDGGQEGMQRRIRMHGNLAENAPLLLILLGLLEISGAWPRWVTIIGLALVLCRVVHPIGLSMRFGPGPNIFRFVGAAGTTLVMLILSVLLLLVALPRWG